MDLPDEPPMRDHAKLDSALQSLMPQTSNIAQTDSDSILPGGLFDPALAPAIPEDVCHKLRLYAGMVEHEAVT